MAKGPPKIETRIVRMRLDELQLLPLNARYLKHETYQRLVANIARDGALTSVPFACKTPGGYLVLSGNHRVKAGIDAGIVEADIMVTDQKLPEARRRAIQLSHNAIVGDDDPATLAKLYDGIDDLDWRAYSGLDDRILELLEEIDIRPLTEADLSWRHVQLMFLPEELELALAAWESAKPNMVGKHEVWVARVNEFGRLVDALDDAGRSFDVRNVATQLLVMLEVFDRHREDLAEGYLEEDGSAQKRRKSHRVPLTTVFGIKGVRADTAAKLRRILSKMRDGGQLEPGDPAAAPRHVGRSVA